MADQLNGISRMLDENRCCGDILIQIAAVEKALQAFGLAIPKQHMQTCMAEGIASGSPGTVDEAIGLIKMLK